jgi:SH3 domain protein
VLPVLSSASTLKTVRRIKRYGALFLLTTPGGASPRGAEQIVAISRSIRGIDMTIGRRKEVSKLALVSFIILSIYLSFTSPLSSQENLTDTVRYVKPISEVAIRRGQGTEYKIIAIVKEGTMVEQLEEVEGYANVRLVDGREGWILTRFLSSAPPITEVLASLQAENEQAKNNEMTAVQKLEEVSSQLAHSQAELETIIGERDQIKTDYLKLQEDTANAVQTNKDLIKLSKENKLLQESFSHIQEENSGLKSDKTINWFLAGGGVLLAGVFLGRISAASRKRKSSLL